MTIDDWAAAGLVLWAATLVSIAGFDTVGLETQGFVFVGVCVLYLAHILEDR